MFNQFNKTPDYTQLNSSLSLVKRLCSKNSFEDLVAAYVILKNIDKSNADEKSVRGWKGEVITKLGEHLNNHDELEDFLKHLRSEIGSYSTAQPKSKL